MAKQNPKRNAQGKKLKKKVNRDVAKTLNKNAMVQRMLLGMNPYLQTLLDPFNVSGVRIPDLNTHPSSSFQVIDRKQLLISAQGCAGIAYGFYALSSSTAQGGSLTPVTYLGPLGTATNSVGMVSGTASNSTDIFQLASPTYLTGWTSNTDVIPAMYQKARLVSCGVVFQYLGAPLNAKGRAILVFAPRNQLRQIAAGGLTSDQLLKVPGSKVIPINTLSGGMVLYQPQDSASLEYADLESTTGSVPSVAVWDEDANLRAAAGGELVIAFDGCTTADLVQITAVFNYEGIPKYNTLNIVSAVPSPNDPIALGHAMNRVQQLPTTYATASEATNQIAPTLINVGNSQDYVPHPYQGGTSPVSSGIKSTNNVQQAEQPTGMFDSILSGIGSVVNDLPGWIEKLTPLAEGLMAFL